MSLLFCQSPVEHRGGASDLKNVKLLSDLCKYLLQGGIFV